MLAMAVAAEGDLLLLDEPTGALDPVIKRRTWNLLREICRDRAVLLTTHDMAEAEALGSRVAIIDSGRVIADASVGELRATLPTPDKIVVDRPAHLVAGIAWHEFGRVEPLGARTLIYPYHPDLRTVLMERLIAASVPFSVTATTLEDVYVQLMTAGRQTLAVG
jgi:ABC-2 type transport system ATP-binding protein